MSRFFVRAAAGLVLISASAVNAQGTRPSAAEIARAVDSLAAQAMAEGFAPALGVAIVLDGKTIYSRSHGWADVTARIPADEKTLWYTASTSKAFTGFGTSLLAHQGALRLDAPIKSLLPNVQWHPTVPVDSLTLASFLSHTHRVADVAIGISGSFTGEIPEPEWPRFISRAARQPNDDLIYSNFGYMVAGMVIDRIRPEGWRRYLEGNVFEPAGMRETYARMSVPDPKRIAKPHDYTAAGTYLTLPFYKTDKTISPAGGHLATLHDLARWTIVQSNGGMIDGRRVFPAEAVATSHRLIARQTRDRAKRFAFFDREGWSAGWDIGSYEGEPMVSRFGSYHTTRSHLSFLPGRRVGAVVMSSGGPTPVTDIIAAFAFDLEAGRPDARERAQARLSELRNQAAAFRASIKTQDSVRAARQRVPLGHPLSSFAGAYHEPAFGTLTFTLKDGALHYQWGAAYGIAQIFDGTKQQLRIELAGSGKVVTFNFPAGAAQAQSVEVLGATLLRSGR